MSVQQKLSFAVDFMVFHGAIGTFFLGIMASNIRGFLLLITNMIQIHNLNVAIVMSTFLSPTAPIYNIYTIYIMLKIYTYTDIRINILLNPMYYYQRKAQKSE